MTNGTSRAGFYRPEERIRLGISACLLGEKVRYDAGHKRDAFLVNTLGEFVEWVGVCPEVECGLGVPREPMRLEGSADSPHLVTIKTRRDLTAQMAEWAEGRVKELEQENICGFVFKSRSPSSGMARVKVYDANGVPAPTGTGMFARAFMDHFPLLPVEDEGRLNDPLLRENFIERVFTLKRYRDYLNNDGSRGGLVEYHTDHKLLIMAHSVEIYRSLGRLVADSKAMAAKDLQQAYQEQLTRALALLPTVRKHVNVLQHIMGYFKKLLSADEKKELLQIIEQYRSQLVPLVVPITLLAHYVRKFEVDYLRRQFYLHPHPDELKLRNHA